MYGLEKDKKFDFDLEVEIKKSPQKKKEIVAKAQEEIQKLKTMIQDKEKPENFEELGVLLNGYEALIKVVEKIK